MRQFLYLVVLFGSAFFFPVVMVYGGLSPCARTRGPGGSSVRPSGARAATTIPTSVPGTRQTRTRAAPSTALPLSREGAFMGRRRSR